MSHSYFSEVPEIAVETLEAQLKSGLQGLQFIDVREAQEVAIASLPGFENLPLSEFAEWSDQIPLRFDPHQETMVLCHHGLRSAQMCQWLMRQGFTDVKNVAGGIDAYTRKVDPTLPRY
ncbi:Thiosulfate sulfurtransferase GlpE [Acaryochloris thomasi RCC1774]|uniref:Thiosulfate sulfurtransferase GlpE n=1 Tax=Acaryochloris thomasi RCC1774 TaxID=1764569 RepID=A0A2W1JKS8_9CYAN|nr:rhodanese-like domain-containing protein [Acaryochloris thomasi]PZD74000.1 Thiosulfate sulfurtransferase GlpE [Acaryochloris thomasi RCC1774]